MVLHCTDLYNVQKELGGFARCWLFHFTWSLTFSDFFYRKERATSIQNLRTSIPILKKVELYGFSAYSRRLTWPYCTFAITFQNHSLPRTHWEKKSHILLVVPLPTTTHAYFPIVPQAPHIFALRHTTFHQIGESRVNRATHRLCTNYQTYTSPLTWSNAYRIPIARVLLERARIRPITGGQLRAADNEFQAFLGCCIVPASQPAAEEKQTRSIPRWAPRVIGKKRSAPGRRDGHGYRYRLSRALTWSVPGAKIALSGRINGLTQACASHRRLESSKLDPRCVFYSEEWNAKWDIYEEDLFFFFYMSFAAGGGLWVMGCAPKSRVIRAGCLIFE